MLAVISAVYFIVLFLFSYVCQRSKLEVDFLDVGQGDAELIKTKSGKIILIDGGPGDLVLRRLGENLPFYRRQIDLIIFSHYHEDHVTGLISVLERYKVNKIIYADNKTAINQTAEAFLTKAKSKSIPIIIVNNRATVKLGDDCILNFLNPVSLNIKSDPNNSLVAKLDCDRQKLLFSGDNNSAVEKALLKSDFDVKADVFKASHHGSNTSNSEAFLNKVAPKLIIIPVGKDNKFGHPSPKVLEKIKEIGIIVKRTDQDNTIKIINP